MTAWSGATALPRARRTRVRQLRRRATDAQNVLWRLLRGRQLSGFEFRRQHQFGLFVLDFFCAERRLAVGVDGAGHFSDDGEQGDARRTEYLQSRGVQMLRFTNTEVLQTSDAVALVILHTLDHAEAAVGTALGIVDGEG